VYNWRYAQVCIVPKTLKSCWCVRFFESTHCSTEFMTFKSYFLKNLFFSNTHNENDNIKL
jgi:hypothetical protein